MRTRGTLPDGLEEGGIGHRGTRQVLRRDSNSPVALRRRTPQCNTRSPVDARKAPQTRRNFGAGRPLCPRGGCTIGPVPSGRRDRTWAVYPSMLDDQRQAAGLDPPSNAGDGRRRTREPRHHRSQAVRRQAPDATPRPARMRKVQRCPRAGRGRAAGRTERRPGILRRHPWWFILGGIALVLLGIAGFFYWQIYLHPYESTDDAFVDARQFSLAPKVSGYVVGVSVTDNQHVEAGATLFQIDRRDYQVALEQAQAQIASAKASIQNVDAQVEAQKAQVEVAKAQVTQNQAALDFAKADAARYRDLASRGAGTSQQSQSSTSTLEQRQAALTSSNAGVVQAAEADRLAPGAAGIGRGEPRQCRGAGGAGRAQSRLHDRDGRPARPGRAIDRRGRAIRAGRAVAGDVRSRREVGRRQFQGDADHRHAARPTGRHRDRRLSRTARSAGRSRPCSLDPAPPSASCRRRTPPATTSRSSSACR